jgi:hypothetical protein
LCGFAGLLFGSRLEAAVKKILGFGAAALAVGLLVMYGVDWGVWRVRVARGGGMGTVKVTWFQVAELKGGKEQFYPDGEGPVNCSQSVFPQGGNKPCWYLSGHPVVFER